MVIFLYLIFPFLIQYYNKIHFVDSMRYVGVRWGRCYSELSHFLIVIIHLDTNIFLNLIFFFFDNKEICNCGHMIYYMMWDCRPKHGKSWLEEARRITSRYMYIAWCSYRRHEVDIWWKYGLHMDIRVGLFIVNINHKNFV